MLNMTIFKKADPRKRMQLQNQKNFEKYIDEQVFSDDESEPVVEEATTGVDTLQFCKAKESSS